MGHEVKEALDGVAEIEVEVGRDVAEESNSGGGVVVMGEGASSNHRGGWGKGVRDPPGVQELAWVTERINAVINCTPIRVKIKSKLTNLMI